MIKNIALAVCTLFVLWSNMFFIAMVVKHANFF